MFSSPTVIIIGAGSSVDFGLPLGKALWERIVSDCNTLPKHHSEFVANQLTAKPDEYFTYASLTNPKAFALFSLMRDARGNVDHQMAKALAEKLARANVHDNVDDFIRDHPTLKRPMQALIAGNLFDYLYQHNQSKSGWKLRRRFFDLKYNEPHGSVKNVENWIRHFVGLCRNQLQNITRGEGVFPITVISFNYDRLIETVLREFWAQSETPYPNIDDCFDFLYPYGAFSELRREMTDAGPWLAEQSEKINITGNGPSGSKTIARKSLDDARQIYMLGFSCLSTNLKWLGLDAKLGKKIFAQNYRGVDQRLARELAKINAQSDTGSVIELVRNGFFEQRGTMLLIDPYGRYTGDEIDIP